MPFIRLNDVSVAFGVRPVLEHAQLQLDKGERLGLIGRNGEGKSTLLKVLSGQLMPDSGSVWQQSGTKWATLEQVPNLPAESTVYEAVADGLGGVGHLIAQYHALAQDPDCDLDKLGHLQHQLESQHGWSLQQKVDAVISRLQLQPDVLLSSLSGGWQRRVALARVLVVEPDVLFLDEPTNHLDLPTILWLEKQLLAFPGALVCVTHDRTFLQAIATRIIELDRGQLTSWPGSYQAYLSGKQAALEAEERQNAEFDKKLAREETWIRQGIKARRTRNEGRVRALEKMRRERAQRRELGRQASMEIERGEASGRMVIEAENIRIAYEGHTLVKQFSTRIMRGDRVGLIGPNGAGKSSLLRVLLKQEQPLEGTVEHGTRLQIAYFDQHRSQLDPESTVLDVVAEGRQSIAINGKQKHIIGYLGDFLFAPERARSPIKALSGGERNRVLLARLFSQPANLLIMDEPTNDLDVETLELLEDLLIQFQGTLLLVSHDRSFMQNVITSSLVYEGGGKLVEYVGFEPGHVVAEPSLASQATVEEVTQKKPAIATTKPNKQKLSYKLQQELDRLPATIEKLEIELETIQAKAAESDFYQGPKETVAETLSNLAALEAKLQTAYDRWDELESD